MRKYLEIKNKLEDQGWYIYFSRGGKSYFSKPGVALIIMADHCTGEHDVSRGCPISYAEKHMPQL
jgi:hypothetical protein